MRPRKPAQAAQEGVSAPQSLQPYNSVAEAAKYLKCSQRAVRQLLARNELDVEQDPQTGRSGITRDSLEAVRDKGTRALRASTPRRLALRGRTASAAEPPEPQESAAGAKSNGSFIEAEVQHVPVKSVPCQPLIHILNEVEDFRLLRGRRYRLSALLVFACAAMLCGCQTYGEIVQWGQTHKALLVRHLGVHRPPSIRTLRLVFRGLDSWELSQSLHAWCTAVAELLKQPAAAMWHPPAGRAARRFLSRLRREARVTGAESLGALGQRLGIWHLTEAQAARKDAAGGGGTTQDTGEGVNDGTDAVLGTILEALFFEGRIAYVGMKAPNHGASS